MIQNYEFTVIFAADEEKMKEGLALVEKTLAKFGADVTKKEDMAIIQEQNLFRTLCPKMVESAAQILDEMIAEGIC